MSKKRISLSISDEIYNELELFRKVNINGNILIKDRSEVYEEALIYGADIIRKKEDLRKKISEKFNIENINIEHIRN